MIRRKDVESLDPVTFSSRDMNKRHDATLDDVKLPLPYDCSFDNQK